MVASPSPPRPSPVWETDALIKVRAVALNWKDGAILNGNFPWPTLENGIPGAEFAGEVLRVGKDVKTIQVRRATIC